MPREEEGVRVAPSRRLVGGYSLTYRYSLTDKSLGLATGGLFFVVINSYTL